MTIENLSTNDNKSLQISDTNLSVCGHDNYNNDDDFLFLTQQRQSRINAKIEENSKDKIEYLRNQPRTQHRMWKAKIEKTLKTICLMNTCLKLTINLISF